MASCLIEKYKPIYDSLRERFAEAEKAYMALAEESVPLMQEIAKKIQDIKERNRDIEKLIVCFPDHFCRAELRGMYKQKFGIMPDHTDRKSVV
jgi:predicted membrane chloride channel (bestrophin family)